MGQVKTWKPWAVFFKPAPTEQQLLEAELKLLKHKQDHLISLLNQCDVDIAYCQHKLFFFAPPGDLNQ